MRKGAYSARCSPSKYASFVASLPAPIKEEIVVKGFGGLLEFKPTFLKREIVTWIMDRLDPDTLEIKVRGRDHIAITEHAVWCVFQLPRTGGDPPVCTLKAATASQKKLALRLVGDEKAKILPMTLQDMIVKAKCDLSLSLRSFFLVTFCTLLFSNTDCYIRVKDALWTEDLDNIGNINWCKAVIDEIRLCARLYHADKKKKAKPPVTGCGMLLTVSFSSQVLILLFCKLLL